ncbi:MAG: alginate export family protein [Bdellovibrionales bacterium]|nr:alginate export family protein [Bdellovibrionales bacterium]
MWTRKMNAIVAVSVMLFNGATALAQETQTTVESPWKTGLNARFRWENSDQYNLIDHKQFSSIRVRPNVTFTGIEKLKVFLEPQFNKTLGAQAYVPTGTAANTPTDTSGNTSYAGSLDTLYMRNAYMDLSLSKELSLIVGRQALAYGDQYILGLSDWGVYGRSFDALRMKYATETVSIDLFQAKIVEDTMPTASKDGDKDLYGLYASFAPSQVLKTVDVYGFYMQDKQADTVAPADVTRPWHFGVYGARFVTDFGAWAWKLEAAKNFGSENSSYMGRDEKNDMIDTRVDYRFGEVYKQKLGLQMFRSGENWRDLFPTTFEAFGRTDVLGRRNVTGAGLRWNAQWSERWSTDVDVYYFQKTGADTTVFQPDSKTAVGSATQKSRDVGSEVDLNVKHMMNKNLTLGGGFNFFRLGSHLKESAGRDRNPTYGYFMIEAKY